MTGDLPGPRAGGSFHPYDDLPALVSGELAPAEADRVGAHLAGCDACRQELVHVARAVGALADAARLPYVDAADLPPLVLPPAAPLRRPRRRTALLTAAAAAAVAVTGTVLLARDRSAEPVVALRPLGGSSVTGTAAMEGEGEAQRMVLRVSGLPAPAGAFYEVWLLDGDRALSVGVLPGSGRAEYTLPASATAGYTAVDVSLEPPDGDPGHSAVSVARGDL